MSPDSRRAGEQHTADGATQPRTWVLRLPAPTTRRIVRDRVTKEKRPVLVPGWLTMNDRIHFQVQAHLTREWRALAAGKALGAGLRRGMLTRARFDAELHFTRSVRRDTSNWHPTVKACIDGLTAGTRTNPGIGVLPDDSPRYLHCADCPHLSFAPNRLAVVPGKPLGLLVLTITDLSGVA